MVENVPAPPADDTPHPRAGQAAFLPRLGFAQQKLVPLLAARGVRTTVAPLYYMRDNPELALVPVAHRLGLALDPATHLRQLPSEARSAAFRGTAWGASRAFDPERDAISDTELEALAHGPLDLQRGRGGTLLLTSFHVVGEIGTRGRELDLLLARAGVAHFRAEHMDAPPLYAANPVSRQVYVSVAVPVGVLRDRRETVRLAAAYLSLGADGIWVKIDGFHERASRADIRAGGAFLRALADGGGTVVSCGSGQLYLGLLTNGVSASIGIGESERFRFPTDWKRATQGRERKGRARSAYHPSLLRSFRVTSEHAERAFLTSRCRCRRHPADRPPSGEAIGEHAAICRADEARDASTGEPVDRREWLLGLATKASWTAADTGLAHTPRAVFESLFAGWADAGEGPAWAGRGG